MLYDGASEIKLIRLALNEQEEQKLKKRLERSLYRGGREIDRNEWGFLVEKGVIEEYEHGPGETEEEKFRELKDSVSRDLQTFQLAQKWNDPSRRLTESESPREPPDDRSEEPFDSPVKEPLDSPVRLRGGIVAYRDEDGQPGDRGGAVHSRGQALHTYERLYANKDDDEIRPTYGAATFLSEGGSGGIPQWIILIHAQAWTSADQIKKHYQEIQDDLSYERGWKLQSRTFDVVRFVWEIELDRGERPSMPELMKLWNARSSKSEAFKSLQNFRDRFEAGEAAVLPRYRHSDERLRGMIENGSKVIAFDRWAARFRSKL